MTSHAIDMVPEQLQLRSGELSFCRQFPGPKGAPVGLGIPVFSGTGTKPPLVLTVGLSEEPGKRHRIEAAFLTIDSVGGVV
jgi:hypothetical protein